MIKRIKRWIVEKDHFRLFTSIYLGTFFGGILCMFVGAGTPHAWGRSVFWIGLACAIFQVVINLVLIVSAYRAPRYSGRFRMKP